jgi:hypothetical protein
LGNATSLIEKSWTAPGYYISTLIFNHGWILLKELLILNNNWLLLDKIQHKLHFWLTNSQNQTVISSAESGCIPLTLAF